MPDLRVAVIHYHLRGGGATSVISLALRAIEPLQIRTVVVSGEPPADESGWAGKSVRVVPELGYDLPDSPRSVSVGAVVKRLRETVRCALGGEPDVWHFHNHSLGKNVTTPRIVRCLAEQGERVLLQIHDFAEDWRPGNYAHLQRAFGADPESMGACLYPSGEHVSYAVLNSRDLTILKQAGARASGVRLLANPVSAGRADLLRGSQAERGERFFLYPTRGIRRKNLGELILWSVLAGGHTRFAVTLAPKNPNQRPIYEGWKAFAREVEAPVVFEASNGTDYGLLMASCQAVVTTSVAEGFGLAFLEPWLAGKPLFGRLLPEVCSDFMRQGIDLSALYERIEIPLKWIPTAELESKVSGSLQSAYQAYGRQYRPDDAQRALGAACRNGCVDFAGLDEDLQRRVIIQLRESAHKRTTVTPSFQSFVVSQEQALEANRRKIGEVFGLQTYGRRLVGLYAEVASSRIGRLGSLDTHVLLSSFTAPERFRLLRSQG